MELEIRMKPPGKVLTQYHRDDSRNVFIMGPLGSAKTFQTCQKLLLKMIAQEANAEGIRPTRFFAIRNTYPDLETTTISDWLELWGELGHFTNGSPPRHAIEFGLPDGTTVKSEMIFLALDRADAIKKLRGTQATGFWLNETKELSKAVVDMADLRHGRYPTLAAGGVKATWHGMLGDTNAPDEDHWYYKLAEETETPGWKFYKQPGGLIRKGDTFVINPDAENLKNLPDDYYVNGQVGKSKEWILVNLCNQYGFVSDGKPIYPEYEDSVHCLPEHPPLYKGHAGAYTITIGIDWGLTPAAVFHQQTPSGQWQALSEVVTEDMGAVRFGELVAQHLATEYPGAMVDVWGDPAGEQRSQGDESKTFAMFKKAAGFAAKPTNTNDPSIRRESVAAPMTRLVGRGEPGYVVSPRCKMYRKALAGGYKYRRLQVVGEEKFTDVPDKNRYSHVAEAGQYAMVGAGEGRKLVQPANNVHKIKARGTHNAKRRRLHG